MVDQEPQEIDSLKQIADTMGISYHPSIGVDKLKAKIDAVKSPAAEEKPEEVKVQKAPKDLEGEELEDWGAEQLETIREAWQAEGLISHTQGGRMTAGELLAKRKKDATRLVRVRVTNMNPIKGNLKGEVLSAGNAQIGFYKKMIPYNAENGWHIPNILLTVLRDKKFMSHYEVKVGNKRVKKHKLVPEYAIEVLDPLTPKEMEDLAQRQIIANKG